jgi:glyceraldehyde 3-phosphate dehydrogenase
MISIAINGFGRIGRNFLRAYCLNPLFKNKIKISAINVGPADPELSAHLFIYDTILGTYPGSVSYENNILIIDGISIPLIAQSSIQEQIWKKYGAEWIIDCSGKYTDSRDATIHIEQGAQKVIISSPAHGEDISIVMGVNDELYEPKKHRIISLTSCTTNAFIPLISVLHNEFGIIKGTVKTVHAYTNSQVLLDMPAKDYRRSRAAALNIIPTSTGALKTLEKIIPELKGRLTGLAIRVPVGNVSFIDVCVQLKSAPSIDTVLALFQKASADSLKGILAISQKPLVSSDFLQNPHSVVLDALLTNKIDDQINVFGWYDNEWAYSLRIVDFLMKWG